MNNNHIIAKKNQVEQIFAYWCEDTESWVSDKDDASQHTKEDAEAICEMLGVDGLEII